MSIRTSITTPTGFLWGASTAAHQTEGGNVNTDWWALEQLRTPVFPELSGDAVDSYHRYPEDIRLLAEAGLTAYRFSIEWARIEPAEGQFSLAQLAHYRRMIDTCIEYGVEPIVTLHHFTLPLWFEARGGWFTPDAPEIFARYVARACSILADVKRAVTINEPNMMAMMQMLKNHLSSGGKLEDLFAQAPDEGALPDLSFGEAIAKAHHAATAAVRENSDAAVGWTIAQQALEPIEGLEDLFHEFNHRLEGFYLEHARDDDFIGVQAYTSQKVGKNGPIPHPPHPANTLTGWAYRPDALGISLARAWEIGRGVPLLITENGIATDDDTRRIAYTSEALGHVEAALANGVDVLGYLHWSLLDNYEWGHWGPTFGLVAVDRETFARTPKPSLAWLGGVARASNAAVEAAR